MEESTYRSQAARCAEGQAALRAARSLKEQLSGLVASVADNGRTGSTGTKISNITSAQSSCVAISPNSLGIAVDLSQLVVVDVSEGRWSREYLAEAEWSQANGRADGGSSSSGRRRRDCLTEAVLSRLVNNEQAITNNDAFVCDRHEQIYRLGDDLGQQVAAVEVDAAAEVEETAVDADDVMPLSYDDIRAAQAADESIRAVIELLEQRPEPPIWTEMQRLPEDARVLLAQWQSLVIVNGMLYRRFHYPDGSTKHLQIVLSERLRTPYIKRLHAEIGHFGQAKTCAAAAERIYFPG